MGVTGRVKAWSAKLKGTAVQNISSYQEGRELRNSKLGAGVTSQNRGYTLVKEFMIVWHIATI